MVIRKATLGEAEKILEFSLEVMKEATMGLVEVNEHTATQVMTDTLMNDGYYLVYEKDHQIKGWLGIGEYYDPYAEKMAGTLVELYVLPAFRKEGIARALLMDGLMRLKAYGFHKAYLNVYALNPAKALYEEFGFSDVSTLMEKEL